MHITSGNIESQSQENPSHNKSVYIFGAGVNRAIKIRYGVNRSATSPYVSPPLAMNFFSVALNMAHGRLAEEFARPTFQTLSSYIERYWKKNISSLKISDFDLEECFTFLELQLREAKENRDESNHQLLVDIEYLLKHLLNEVLSEFNDLLPPFLEPDSNSKIERFGNCDSFKRLGEILYSEKSVVISFNWDDFIERAIEQASKRNSSTISTTDKFKEQVSDEELGQSYWNWNRALGYGMKFDQTMMYDGGEGTKQKYFQGNRFYSNPDNNLYPWPLLKLYGSLNWFRYLPATPISILTENELKKRFQEVENSILPHEVLWVPIELPGSHPSLNNLYIDPIIITPILYKEKLFNDPLYSRILTPLWKKAKVALSNCKRLIVIGYSFPPTDFMTRKMFLEAFSDTKLEELTIVNPSENAIDKVKDLCHFKDPVTFKNLEDYLDSLKPNS